MEMKNVIAREGREAKNLLLYHLSSEDDLTQKPNVKKPPSIKSTLRKSMPSQSSSKSGPRVRSASTGRDKRSEMQARYWALLFGNLQRAINEIYQTVECYENLSSCQETILVLENYIRDFRALAEWFRMSWNYDATPQPQRPQSLAWEVRKSNPAPRLRAKSMSSPSPNLSGKSSPCPSYSGKSSPCSVVDETKLTTASPRKKLLEIKATVALSNKTSAPESVRIKSPRLNVRELMLNKTSDADGPLTVAEPSANGEIESPLTKIPEEVSQISWNDMVELEQREEENYFNRTDGGDPVVIVVTCDQYSQTDGFEDEYLTLQQWRDKYENATTAAVAHTVQSLDAMENLFLEKNVNRPSELIVTTNQLSTDPVVASDKENLLEKPSSADKKRTISPDGKKVQTVVPLKYSNVVNRSLATSKPVAAAKSPAVVNKPTTRPSIVTKAAPQAQATANSILNRKVPAKTVPAAPLNRAKTALQPRVPPANDGKRQVTSAPLAARTIPSNTASRLANRSKTMIDFSSNNGNAKPPANKMTSRAYEANSLSRDSFGSSTSTLRASTDQIANNAPKSNVRRSEPRTMPTHSEDNDDGWLTVKARRRSSMHWSNRFDQPTGYASLPTLTSLSGDKEKDTPKMPNGKKENRKPAKTVTNKPEQQQPQPQLQQQAVAKVTDKQPTAAKVRSKVQQTVPVPVQEPPAAPIPTVKPKPVRNVPEKSSIVSRATILQRQKSDITGLKLNTLRREYQRKEKKAVASDSGGSGDSKVSMNIQTTMGMSTAMYDLYASCIEANGIEELDNDEDQRKLLEEQECLERQILELQNSEIEIDTETDDADCETILEESGDSTAEIDHCLGNIDDGDDLSLEARYQYLLSDMSSGERIQTLATLQAIVSRHPGRAQELHQKLSSPSRRRSLHETLKKYQAKQARAQNMRELLHKEKTLKIQTLLARVEDVKAAKQHLIEEKRSRMEEKLQRYAENRSQYLKDKVRKAHDEEEKLKEIAFIKSLEAQNKRLDMLEMRKEQEIRLHDLEQERQKRMDEKAAKEAAVERRRMELAKERQKRLEKMDETRREREQRVEQMQEEKEKLRQKIAREKARDREERLLALQVQQQQTTEELQRKIIQKQQESARRHEENIEHIRQRALELSIPSRNVDENGVRTESADRGAGEDDLSSVVSDLSIEQTKASRKKLKKLRQKLAQSAEEYMSGLDQVPMYMRRDSTVPKILGMMRKGGGPQGMERPLNQLVRIVAKPEVFDFQCLWLLDGLGVLANVIRSAIEPNSELSRKALITAVQIYRNSCSPCPQIARHAILGNSISVLFDALLYSLQTPDDKTPSHPIELSTELMLACSVVLSPLNTLKQPHPKVLDRLPDLISYAVSIGLIDILSRRCMKIREPIENHQSVVLSILACLGLLTKFADTFPKDSNPTKFLSVVKSTELFGAISLLYATVVPVGECIPPRTISLAAATFNLILTLANLDLSTFQLILSQEALSLQFLDVVSILLKYCGPKSHQKGETQAVIVDLVATLGFFCANNEKNQNLLLNEQSSVIIKGLSKLPKTFDIVVYPTLLTIICDNDGAKSIIARDFDLKCIEEYQNSEMAKKNKMLSMLKSPREDTPSTATA